MQPIIRLVYAKEIYRLLDMHLTLSCLISYSKLFRMKAGLTFELETR